MCRSGNKTFDSLEDVDKQWAWYRTKLLHNGERVGTEKHLTDELSDKAVDFIERKKDEPFFLYLAYNAPHTPMQASEEYLARFPDIQNPKRRAYAAMVSAVDDGMGLILDKLDEHDLSENTIVFFLPNNNGATNNASNNWPLRGHKGTPFEGGVRVPFAVRWTGTIPAGQDFDHPVIALDIAGTIVSQAGASDSPGTPLDGIDLTPYLTGEQPGPPHDMLFWRWYKRDRLVVRRGHDKLIHEDDKQQLFNLASNTAKKNNLASSQSELVSELQATGFNAMANHLADSGCREVGFVTVKGHLPHQSLGDDSDIERDKFPAMI